MTTIAIIQARTGSTRLPGKVFLNLADKPMLVRCIERVQKSKKLDDVVIATTTKQADDKIVTLCNEEGWNYYRGSENDLLDRYYNAARKFSAKKIVRITSDCPMIEPLIIDQVIEKFFELLPDIDYVSNVFPIRTYPRGLDTEMLSFDTLERCWKEDTNPAYREHVTQFIQHNPQRFRISGIQNETDLSSMRWTVDTPEDLEFVQRIYNHFGNGNFTWIEALNFLHQHLELLEINRHIKQKVI
jgi:spore coat polysaccharide biosynthesis protein SpsF